MNVDITKSDEMIIDYRGYFGDKRLEVRGSAIMAEMVKKETVVLNQLSNNRAELVGSSRFFNNDSVTEAALIQASSDRCRNAVKGKHILAIQDTTDINYQSHRGKLNDEDQELGPVGHHKNIGFFLHPVLVLDCDNGFPLGIGFVAIWNRDWDLATKTERNYQSLPIEEKESYRWIECNERSKSALSSARHVTIVADFDPIFMKNSLPYQMKELIWLYVLHKIESYMKGQKICLSIYPI